MSSQVSLRREVRRAAIAIAVVFSCGLLAPAFAAAATGSISGKVTEAAVGHAPIEGAEVCAEGVGPAWDFACDLTDATGSYVIPGLDPDDYVVEFWAGSQGFVLQYYDGKASWSEADEVTVASATTTPSIDAELVEGAKIEGTVIDAVSKAGLGQVSVCAWSETEEEFGCAETDGNGDYVIGGLVDGDYEVKFWAYEEPDYVVQYYDGKTNWEEATLVPAAVGVPATGIDAELSKGGRIAGTITHAANGAPLSGIAVCAREGAGSGEYVGYCDLTNGSGAYTLQGLPTGSYKVEFSPELEGQSDGFPTEYYNDKPNMATAELVPVTAPQTTVGINAQLGMPPQGLKAFLITPPASVASDPAPGEVVPKPGPKKCKKGFRRKNVKGKIRCVKIAKRRSKGKAGKRSAALPLFAPASPHP